MPAYRRKYQRRYKSSRPSDRIIRAGNVSLAASTQEVGYLYEASDPQTVTNIKLDTGSVGPLGGSIPYALVHIPEGYDANTLTYPAVTEDLYNPTKNVLISGVIANNGAEDHKYSRYSRKLAPGDRIGLIFLNTSTENAEVVTYEISFTCLH